MTATVAPTRRKPARAAASATYKSSALACLEKLKALAEQAFNVDGTFVGTGDVYASRIDCIAAQTIDKSITWLAGQGTEVDENAVRFVIFDIEALVRGAELAGPTCIPERTALHLEMLQVMADFMDGSVKPYFQRIAPMTRAEPAPINGHEPAHVVHAFHTISNCAEAVRDDVNADDFGSPRSRQLVWTQAVLIGALADQMNGFANIGTLASWVTGDGVDLDIVRRAAA